MTINKSDEIKEITVDWKRLIMLRNKLVADEKIRWINIFRN